MTSLSTLLKKKAEKIKELVSLNENLPVKHVVYHPQKRCFAEYFIEFDGAAQIDGQIVLDVYIDTSACYIIVGVRDDTATQKNRLEKHLKKNKVEFCQWLDSDVYLQLKEYSVFKSETLIAEDFQGLLSIILSA
jgi:hypothetical protein